MRVDRGGIKGFSGEVSGSDKETRIERSDGKVKLTAGKEDQVLITQAQDSLRIQVNGEGVVALSREESKNLEILPGEGQVSIDSNVTIPIRCEAAKTEETASRIDPSVSSGRREETSLTSSITQKLLTSELLDELSGPEVPSAHVALETPGPVRLDASLLITKPIDINVDRQDVDLQETLSNKPFPDVGEPVTATEQTVSFIRAFIGSPSVSLADQQKIQSFLASAESPEEFNKIVYEAGEKKIAELFKNDEMIVFWDRLVGGFDRMDLAENQQEAMKTRELFVGDPNHLKQYLPSSDQSLILRGNVLSNEIDLSPLDRRAKVCVVLENAVRTLEGRPLINSNQLREKTLDVLLDSTIPAQERPVLLENLRTETGLSEYQMREIVSRPLSGFFESMAEDLGHLRGSQLETFQQQIQDAVDNFGTESVAVEIGLAERDEFLQNMEPEIAQFEVLKTTASEIFSGPADPLVKVDSLLQRFQTDFMPSSQILPLLQNIDKGAIVIEDGKLQSSLLKVQIPELKSFVQQGILFFDKLKNAGAIVEKASSFHIDGFENFGFLQRLVDGAFRRQLRDFAQSFNTYQAISSFREIDKGVSDWRSKYETTTTLKDREFKLETGKRIMQDFAGGLLTKPLNELARNVTELRLEQHCAEVIESIQTGSDLLIAFRNGHFVQILAAVGQRAANSPGLLRIIQQGLHLTNSGTNFFRGLMNRDWEKPIAQALKKDPRSKELREVYSILSDALNLFLPLQSIDYLTPFVQYQKQLANIKDETLRNELIQRYEAEASGLL